MSRHATSATSWGENPDFYNPFPPEIDCPVSYPTLLPVPETRIGDLTMYIPSRGLNDIISVRLVNFIVVIIDGRCLLNFLNDNTPQFNAILHGFVQSEDIPNELFLLQFHRHSHGIVGSIVRKFWNDMITHGI
ncbi:hypothetical protein M9H77_16487 [Catharanthus roseus]|uniref:Uncharacterized protein n=1 Tax=Catharanthus roseus TaxID=4058 RepID=A0ACC0B1W2_CATRO|nr:hypothetical protein M9H77_16487 [Catharanthus roseus]